MDFLRGVWSGLIDANANQVRAASAALPFVHKKLGDGGKKSGKEAAAEGAGKGLFAPSAPPKLVAVK